MNLEYLGDTLLSVNFGQNLVSDSQFRGICRNKAAMEVKMSFCITIGGWNTFRSVLEKQSELPKAL
jgi:hypothetical protein